MSLAILFHFLCIQHVSDINISIIRSLRLCYMNYHIGRIVLGSMCVGVSVWLSWSGILFHFLCAQHVSDINISIIRSLRLCCMNYHIGRIVLGSMCVGVSVWLCWSGILFHFLCAQHVSDINISIIRSLRLCC